MSANERSGYAERLRGHLSAYKRQRLGVDGDGIDVRHHVAYPHLLPRELYRLNVLETIRAEFWKYWCELEQGPRGRRIRLHPGFHHLNSSQALAFNLFFPFFGLADADPSVLLEGFGIPETDIHGWAFEAVPDRTESTNFDFLAMLGTGGRLLVEVKFSEGEFGSCKADDVHRRKFEDIYLPRLRSKVEPDLLVEDAFFQNYQLLRNIIALQPQTADSLVLLMPKANRA